MCGLAGMCNRHANAEKKSHASSEDGGYAFWEQHFAIDKKVNAISEQILHHLGQSLEPHDALVLTVRLNFCAVTIYLHEIATEKAISASVPVTLMRESIMRCESAAVNVASILHQLQQWDGYQVSHLKTAS